MLLVLTGTEVGHHSRRLRPFSSEPDLPREVCPARKSVVFPNARTAAPRESRHGTGTAKAFTRSGLTAWRHYRWWSRTPHAGRMNSSLGCGSGVRCDRAAVRRHDCGCLADGAWWR